MRWTGIYKVNALLREIFEWNGGVGGGDVHIRGVECMIEYHSWDVVAWWIRDVMMSIVRMG